MSEPFVDTDVIIRLLTGDDPNKQRDAAALFRAVKSGALELAAPDTVIADAVFVLSSRKLYNLPRARISAILKPLVRLPGFKLPNRRTLLNALDLYASSNLDFGDALIAASMEQAGSDTVVSYDVDFDRVPHVIRRTPRTVLPPE